MKHAHIERPGTHRLTPRLAGPEAWMALFDVPPPELTVAQARFFMARSGRDPAED